MTPATTGAGRRFAPAALTAGAAVGAIGVLQRVGDATRLPGLDELGRGRADAAVDLAMSGLRLVGLALAWYVLATLALGTLARTARLTRTAGALDAISLPFVRRAVRAAVTTGLAATVSITSAAGALAQTAGPAPGATVPGRPPVMRVLDGADPDDPAPVAGAEAPAPGQPAPPDAPPAPATTTPDAPATPAPTSAPVPGPPETVPAKAGAPDPGPPSPGQAATTPAGAAGATPPVLRALPADPANDPTEPPPDRPDAPAPDPAAGSPDAATAEHWQIRPGDHLWHVAEATLAARWGRPPTVPEVAAFHQRLIAANRERFVVAGQPDLVFPGQVFVLPVE